ncbi:hypothetical protein [Mycobacteroides abscessus]
MGKVYAVTASFRGCCAGCEDGYCSEYDEGTPVLSMHATRELAEAAAAALNGDRVVGNYQVDVFDITS